MKRILVPTDFSEPSLAAVRYGLALADAVDTEILLLHVVEGSPSCIHTVGGPPTFFKDYVDPDGGLSPSPFRQRIIRRDLCEEAQWKLVALFSPGYRDRVRAMVTVGKAADEIIHVAREQHIDLIIMGSRGRRGLKRLFHRTVTDKVRQRAAIPVLTLDAPHRSVAGDLRSGRAAYEPIAGDAGGCSRTTPSPLGEADRGAGHPMPLRGVPLEERGEQPATKRSRAVGV